MDYPPSEDVVAVEEIDIVVSDEPNPFHIAHRDEAERRWTERVAQNPAFFNGTVMLHSTMEISGGRLCSRAQRVPYSTLLFWRERRPVAGSWHLFASPLLVSREGRLVLIRMAQHTANAGLIYSPCGSLDEADITGDRVDIDGNMQREVMEETGLDLAAARAEAGYGVVRTGGVVVVARRFFFDLPAERMVAQARAHMEAEAVSEIDDVFSIGGPEEATARYQFFMPHLLRWHFGAKQ